MKARSLSLIVVLAFPTAVVGQHPGPKKRRPVAITASLGAAVGGPASGLADQLRQVGFDDASPCFLFCSGTIAHPSEQRPSIASGVTLRFPVNQWLAIGSGFSTSDLGGANGFEASSYQFIFSYWTASIVWAGAFWTPDPGLRLGGGPAWYRLRTHHLDDYEISHLGLMGEAGLEFPSNRTFFLDLAVRLNVVPEDDVQYLNYQRETLPSLRPNWTHVQFLAGFGIHL